MYTSINIYIYVCVYNHVSIMHVDICHVCKYISCKYIYIYTCHVCKYWHINVYIHMNDTYTLSIHDVCIYTMYYVVYTCVYIYVYIHIYDLRMLQ